MFSNDRLCCLLVSLKDVLGAVSQKGGGGLARFDGGLFELKGNFLEMYEISGWSRYGKGPDYRHMKRTFVFNIIHILETKYCKH